MKIIVFLIMIMMLGCARKNSVLEESRFYTYELEIKVENDNPVLYLYLENLSNDTLMLMRHSLYCGAMPLYIYTLDDHQIGSLGYSADCSPIKFSPLSRDTASMGVYELITAGGSKKHYDYIEGALYKVKLSGGGEMVSNEIIFRYDPPEVEIIKPILGKFKSKYTSEGYQIYAKMFDDDISLDRMYYGTYNNLDSFVANQIESKEIYTEKKDSIFSITFSNKVVDDLYNTYKVDRKAIFIIQLYLKNNVDKYYHSYFFPKKKDE